MNMVDKRCSCCGGENPEKVQIDAILARYQGKKGSLIPILQEVQALYNYLPKDALEYIAASTGTPIAQIYGVVTFYSQFHLNPRGRNIIRVCQGTACHVRGGKVILQTIEKELGIPTPYNEFTYHMIKALEEKNDGRFDYSGSEEPLWAK